MTKQSPLPTCDCHTPLCGIRNDIFRQDLSLCSGWYNCKHVSWWACRTMVGGPSLYPSTEIRV